MLKCPNIVMPFSPPNEKEAAIILALWRNGYRLRYCVEDDEFSQVLQDGKQSRKRLLRKLLQAGLLEEKGGIWRLTRHGREVARGLKIIKTALENSLGNGSL